MRADGAGNVYYNAVQVNLDWPWDEEVVNAWLVKVAPDDTTTTTTYAALLPGAPTKCLGTFDGARPWPPSNGAVPPNVPCGLQRPALNLASNFCRRIHVVHLQPRALLGTRSIPACG